MNTAAPARTVRGRVRLELIAMGFAAAVIGAAVLIALSFRQETFRISGSSVDIRLAGVRPDASDDVYDVFGKKIGTRFYDGNNLNAWGSNMIHRDFIFEWPREIRVQPAGYTLFQQQQWPLTSEQISPGVLGNRRSYSASATMAGHFWHSSMFFGARRPLEFVDVTLEFYLPDRGQPRLAWRGPFVAGVTNNTQTATQQWGMCELVFDGGNVPSPATNACFRFSTTMGQLNRGALTFLDREGHRHFPRVTNFAAVTRGSQLWIWTGFVPGVGLERIAGVEIHLPQHKTFHHVRVRYPDRPERSYPAVNDKVLAALAATGAKKVFAPEQVGSLHFTNAARAAAVIDVLRGTHLVDDAWRVIAHSSWPLDFNSLSSFDRQRLRNAADAWVSADEPVVRSAGANLGLRCGWREFVTPALEVLPDVSAYHANDLLLSLTPFAEGFSESQIEIIARRGLQDQSSSLLHLAASCLRSNQTAAASNAIAHLRAAQQARK